MKFDSSRVLSTVEDLAVPRFAGPNATPILVEFASERLDESGWLVERIGSSHSELANTPPPNAGFIARFQSDCPAPCRVVVQAVLGNPYPGEATSRLGSLIQGWRKRKAEVPPARLPIPAELSGLALLLELARTWPKNWNRRVELVVVAAGGRDFDGSVIQELARRLDPAATGLPTLLLPLIAPGVGRELIAVGQHQETALACARSLWIPVSGVGSSALLRRFLQASTIQIFPDHVTLIGAGVAEAGPLLLDPDALNRTAQLISEIALRWARQIAPSADQAVATPPRSEARSSQNPG